MNKYLFMSAILFCTILGLIIGKTFYNNLSNKQCIHADVIFNSEEDKIDAWLRLNNFSISYNTNDDTFNLWDGDDKRTHISIYYKYFKGETRIEVLKKAHKLALERIDECNITDKKKMYKLSWEIR